MVFIVIKITIIIYINIDNYIHCLIFNYENNLNLNLNYINNKIKFYKKYHQYQKFFKIKMIYLI